MVKRGKNWSDIFQNKMMDFFSKTVAVRSIVYKTPSNQNVHYKWIYVVA